MCTQMNFATCTAPSASFNPITDGKIAACYAFGVEQVNNIVFPPLGAPHYTDILKTFFAPNRTKIELAHLGSGASWKSYEHYLQHAEQNRSVKRPEDQLFQAYDYGASVNQKKYGSPKPPAWDLTKIRTKTAMLYGEWDTPSNWKDIQYLSYLIPKKYHDARRHSHLIPGFSHASFLSNMNEKAFRILEYELGLRKNSGEVINRGPQ